MKKHQRHWLALYHPLDKDAQVWGVYAINVGHTVIPPKTLYPPQHHPNSYLFTWEQGRVLSEYQFLAVKRGQGVIETASAGTHEVHEGDIFVLFPGEWHRFRPAPETGWDECWVGFGGDYARHLMQAFFSPQSPVLRGAATPEINRQMMQIAKGYKMALPEMPARLASKIIALITQLVIFTRMAVSPQKQARQSKVTLARNWMLERAFESTDPKLICEVVGMGYSAFRKMFKEETGYAPHQYLLEIRLNRAKALLQQTDLTITQVAEQTGFASIFYFTRFFARHAGVSPTTWRETQAALTYPRSDRSECVSLHRAGAGDTPPDLLT